ncbi:hypothetical protein EV10_0122 [Prochlorococcus marinus str. SS51]|nr:hypothetical protein [Prochlorococcus marinus]KGG34086.1 hypothetical protein EV10_0122 [Prochlorococcus marinus str. SS51]
MKEHNNFYDNADSFAMVFDEAWKEKQFKNDDKLTIDQKIETIIEQNKDHPFIKSSPAKAISVAKFRLRLLQLE